MFNLKTICLTKKYILAAFNCEKWLCTQIGTDIYSLITAPLQEKICFVYVFGYQLDDAGLTHELIKDQK